MAKVSQHWGGMAHLEPYGGDHFSFVLIGIAFSGYPMTALMSFSESIRGEQMMGTLEAMLVTPTSASAIITLSSLWRFIFTSFRVLMYLVIGILLGVDMSNANIIGAMVILALFRNLVIAEFSISSPNIFISVASIQKP